MSESALRGGRFRACLTGSVWLHFIPPVHPEVHAVPVFISVMYHALLDHYGPLLTMKRLAEVLHTTDLDKALAVMALKRLTEAEQGEGSVTQTQLAEALSDLGYALSQGLISQMAYTVERLLPAALKGGMGRPQVERIRQLERAVRALWLDRTVDTEDELDQVFAELYRRYESPEWDIGNLRRARLSISCG